jgi:glycosyltransferase involved in cell wall biosynthesis
MPVVSVVIPTHDRADLVLEAVNSVLVQDYTDYEIIVVDDGSSDETEHVLSRLIQNGIIRYYYQNNQGEAAARNFGIIMSKGEFVAFLDSDDLFEPKKLGRQVEYLRAHPEVGLVHSSFVKFNNLGQDLGHRNTSWFSGYVYPQILLYWTTLMAVDTVIVPRKVFDDIGLFDIALKMGTDLDMWRRIARRYPFGFINQSLARIRVHEGNVSGDRISATDGFVQYLEKAFSDDPSLSKWFRQRVFSKMFSTMAYNLLSGNGREFLQAARSAAYRAILTDPFNHHGYFGFISTLLGYNSRLLLVRGWRSLRGWLMSRNKLT